MVAWYIRLNKNNTRVVTMYENSKRAGKLSFMLTGIGMAPWAAIMPYVKDRLALDEIYYAQLLLSFGIGAVIGMPLAGIICKRFGFKNVIVLALFLLFLTVLAISSPSIAYVPAIVAVTLWGFLIGILEVANNIYGTFFEDLTKQHLLSGFQAYSTIGCIFSAIIYPVLLPFNLSPFRVSILITVPCLLLILFCHKYLINTHGQRSDDKSKSTISTDNTVVCFQENFTKFHIVMAGIACLLMFLCEGMIYDWSGVYLNAKCNVSLEIAAIGYAIFQLAVAIMRLLGDRLVSKIGGIKLLCTGSIVAFITLQFIAFHHEAIVVITSFAIAGLALGNVVPVIISTVAKNCGKNKSAAISTVGTIGYSGVLIGPALLGLLADKFGLEMIFSFVGVLTLVMCALCWYILSANSKRMVTDN